MGLIQLYTWMTWIAHSMTGDLGSSGSVDSSCIVFDSSYVSDPWDWFGSILFVMDQELWYDPTLGHSHLREFFFYRMTIMSRHTLLSRWRIFEPCPFLGGYQMSFFHIGAWDMISAFHLVCFTQGHTPFRSIMVLGMAVPWRCSDSLHIGVLDMIGWWLLLKTCYFVACN